MPGRGMGERLAIDPQNNKIIYFGARSGNGLWKSVDQGVTFTKVTSFTAVGMVNPFISDFFPFCVSGKIDLQTRHVFTRSFGLQRLS